MIKAIQKILAKFLLTSIIIITLAILFSFLTHTWIENELENEFENLSDILTQFNISGDEYIGFLFIFYLIFFVGVTLLESVIGILITNVKT